MKFANADFENPETRRMLFEYFVDKIYLYEDRLVFISWYSEENREVPYEALNGDDEGRPSSSIASPLAPRSPNRPLSRMGCGGDYRFQSRGRTAVGFYHPAGRPTASPAGYFYAQLVGPVLPVRSGVYRRARGCSGDRIVMRTPSEKAKTHPMA